MYLVYESLYGELLCECDGTNIIGLFSTKEKALKKAKELIDEELKEGQYVLDETEDNIDKHGYVRFFYKEQENWGCFYELFVEELEVK